MRRLVRRLGVTRHHLVAGVLGLVGFGLTVYLGVLAGTDSPPSGSTSALLVVLAGVFQLGGAVQFNRIGKADPGLARASVRRLIKMALRAKRARFIAEDAYESDDPAKQRKAAGYLSADLSWLEEGISDAIDDWKEFHKEALEILAKDEQDAEGQD